MDTHVILVSKRFHAHGTFALARLDTIIHAFAAYDMTAHIDDGVFDVAAAVAINDRLKCAC